MKPTRDILFNSYWGKLFKKDKFLFILAFSFFFFSIVANIIRLETSPFFLWNLYSDRYYSQPEYTISEIRYNNKLLNFKHTWQAHQQVFLTDPLHHYLAAKNNGGIDPLQDYIENYWARKHPAYRFLTPQLYNKPEQYQGFPAWYKKYISSIKNEEVKTILVLNKNLRFENSGQVSEISSDSALLIQ
jgi:hypothetical protein